MHWQVPTSRDAPTLSLEDPDESGPVAHLGRASPAPTDAGGRTPLLRRGYEGQACAPTLSLPGEPAVPHVRAADRRHRVSGRT